MDCAPSHFCLAQTITFASCMQGLIAHQHRVTFSSLIGHQGALARYSFAQ